MSLEVSTPSYYYKGQRLSYKERIQIQTLRHDAEWTLEEISNRMKRGVSTIHHAANCPSTPTKPHRIDSRLINTPIRDEIVRLATASRQNRGLGYAELGRAMGIQASARTIRRALRKAGHR
ncbi:MAG: hypothetical protein M1829_001532 [Trizodia sp. TS-e1964]|nr:MAG: hypothetical protein M1829_001532 [Trizodia sp. TS-e1964]